MSTLCMLLHLSALIALMRGLSMSSPRCPCPVFCMYLFFFCMYLSVEACLSPSLPFAVFALRLVGCDNVCCSSLVFFFFGIYKTKRYIDTLGVHSWEPPGTSRYAQHQR